MHYYRTLIACFLVIVLFLVTSRLGAQPPLPSLRPLMRAVDLNVGESAMVELIDGAKVTVKLLDLRETRDELRDAGRRAEVKVEVDGKAVHPFEKPGHYLVRVERTNALGFTAVGHVHVRVE